MNDERILTCAYCGHEYPQDSQTWGTTVLTDHIKICKAHPMKKICDDYKRIRKALADFVGGSDEEELKAMEMGLRMLPAPNADVAAALNAIAILRATEPLE